MLLPNWKDFQNYIRGKRSIENIFVTGIQRSLNYNQRDLCKSLLFGQSKSKQGIESLGHFWDVHAWSLWKVFAVKVNGLTLDFTIQSNCCC